MRATNQKQLMESKFKNGKHPQIIHSCDQSDLNVAELRRKKQNGENMKCAYFSSHSDMNEFNRK